MSSILCHWLNDELQLSTKIDEINVAKEFATGYLVGELLSKYGLQPDFNLFSKTRTTDAKLNNFTRLEPTLHLLGVTFDTNVAKNMMTQKHDAATRLLYQLFIALNKKQKANLTGTAMETMRAAGPVKLQGVESMIYTKRLKEQTPRQTDLNLQEVSNRFVQKKIELEKVAFRQRLEADQQKDADLQQKRQDEIQKYKENVTKKTEMLAKIQEQAVNIPKTPPGKTAHALQQKQEEKTKLEAQEAIAALSEFDHKMLHMIPITLQQKKDAAKLLVAAQMQPHEQIKIVKVVYPNPVANQNYVKDLQQRTLEVTKARSERQKRRRKVFMDQLKAQEVQEELRREEMLVNRLMRQAQQERRIAVQLLETRHEKEVIRQNRIKKEQQYEWRRLKEFHVAMNREREKARQAKLEYAGQIRKDRDLHDRMTAETTRSRYRRHWNYCSEILGDIVDFAMVCVEYRKLTNKLIPAKLFREWKEQFCHGIPLVERVALVELDDNNEPTPGTILEEERQKLLDETDLVEYAQMTGEWHPPDDIGFTGPPPNNPILGYVIHRISRLNHPPTPPPPPPEFPPFPIKACVVGKSFAGKTTALLKLAQFHRIKVLQIDELIQEALDAFNNNELREMKLVSANSNRSNSAKSHSRRRSSVGEKKQDAAALAAQQEKERLSSEPTVRTDNDGDTLQESEDSSRTVPHDDDFEVAGGDDKGSNRASGNRRTSKGGKSNGSGQGTGLHPQPSERAKIGGKIFKVLKRGKAVDDQLMIDLFIEAIHQIPEGSGWVIDGFPTTLNQAKALEKAFLPPVGEGSESSTNSRRDSLIKLNKTKGRPSLVNDPKAPPPPPEPGSCINAIVLLNCPDDLCLRRSAGRTRAIQTMKNFQFEFKPPPEGSATGIGAEKVEPVDDPTHEQEQLQIRLTNFSEMWPKVEKFYAKYGNVHVIDASPEEETVFLELEHTVEGVIKKLQGPTEEELMIMEQLKKMQEEKEEDARQREAEAKAALEHTHHAEPPKVEEEPPTKPPSRKGSATRSNKGSSHEMDKKSSKGSASKRDPSAKDSKKNPGKGGAVAGGSAKGGKNAKKTPEPEPETEPQAPPGTPPPQPGSEEWVYVNLDLTPEIYIYLAPYWEEIEKSYLSHNKKVFRNVRRERDLIIRYLYKVRQEYINYLRRPDVKQEYIDRWQQEYNDVPEDMHDDEETRAQLHQTVDDLREELWNICDKRKEQAENQREAVMKESWLDDHLALLANHYMTLMQGELDKYQDTQRLLKDYYKGMEGHIPDELSMDFARVPLVEIPPNSIEDGEEEPPKTAVIGKPSEEPKALTPAKAVGSKGSKIPTEEVVEKPKIPLVPRRPVSPDLNAQAKTKAEKGKVQATKGKEEVEVVPLPGDPDERLVFEAYNAAVSAIEKMYQAEQAAREAEEAVAAEAERLKEEEKAKATAAAAKTTKKEPKGKAADKGKASAKGNRSPSPKKKEDDTPEEREKRLQIDRGYKEFFAALAKEADAAKCRLTLIKLVSCAMMVELKKKAEYSFNDMNDWLGARFLKEMESIDHLSEVMRYSIEAGVKIKEELILRQQDFMVDFDYKTIRSPTPPPRPSPQEPVLPDLFTVGQINSLYEQFKEVAPSGLMAIAAFTDTFLSMVALTFGTDDVPAIWSQVTPEKVEVLARELSADGEYIDWRSFLLSAAQPWPYPTQTDLLDTLAKFKDMDQKDTGFVTQEQYDRMQLWFATGAKPDSPDDLSAPYPFHRLTNLKDALFELFTDHTIDPPLLDYKHFLMYFSKSHSPYLGFLRALSILVGQPLPRIPLDSGKLGSRSGSMHSLEDSQNNLQDSELLELLEDDVPESANNSKVALDQLLKTLEHGVHMRGDSHRFSVQSEPDDAPLQERLEGVYQELGADALTPLPFTLLMEHPIIQDIIRACLKHKAVDLKLILSSDDQLPDSQSSKTGAE